MTVEQLTAEIIPRGRGACPPRIRAAPPLRCAPSRHAERVKAQVAFRFVALRPACADAAPVLCARRRDGAR